MSKSYGLTLFEQTILHIKPASLYLQLGKYYEQDVIVLFTIGSTNIDSIYYCELDYSTYIECVSDYLIDKLSLNYINEYTETIISPTEYKKHLVIFEHNNDIVSIYDTIQNLIVQEIEHTGLFIRANRELLLNYSESLYIEKEYVSDIIQFLEKLKYVEKVVVNDNILTFFVKPTYIVNYKVLGFTTMTIKNIKEYVMAELSDFIKELLGTND